MAFALRYGGRQARINLNYLGRHNVTNALSAAALTLGAGVSSAAVRRGLAQAKPFTMRMQRESWRGIGIINDSYNANPGSMQAALETLALIGGRGKKIAVLGDMFELGKHNAKEHRQLGRVAAQARVESTLPARRPSRHRPSRRAGRRHESAPGNRRRRSPRFGHALAPTSQTRRLAFDQRLARYENGKSFTSAQERDGPGVARALSFVHLALD